MKSKLAHLDSGSTQLTEANFSSPSSHEMGESSETTAEASSDEPKPPMLTGEVADRQAVPPMVVQSSCVSGTSSDSLTVGRTEAVCSFLDGFNSDGLKVPQMVAGNGSLCLRVAPIELGCSLSDGFSSDGHTGTQMVLGCERVSSGDSVMPQGQANEVATSFSMGFFLAAALHRMLGAGLVDYGVHGVVNAGRGSRVHLSQGVDDKCTRQIVVTETDQAKLALIESKSVFCISDLGGSIKEGGANSEVACLGLQEQFMYKNHLQEYAQRSAIQLPVYKTVNEGSQHAPMFRSTVVVDGQIYTSPNTFLKSKIAEQDVSKLALEHISKKIKDERCPLTPPICEVQPGACYFALTSEMIILLLYVNVRMVIDKLVFCKSILNEFAVKMNLQKPIYNTVQTEGLPAVFISSVVFNGVCYNGEPGGKKKEAEQLAARAVILSHLDKLYSAFHKVKDKSHANISAVPQGPNIRAMEVAILGSSSRTQVRTELKVPPPEPSTQLISAQPSSQAVNLQSGVVLADLPEPSVVGPSSSKKRKKNQEEADKKLQSDTHQLSLAALPMTQAPPSSLA
ncbi:double-stranded rna-binding protein 1 [Quercus suber]|uniref:Double-stranded rna-binding protein 1 n=1 Tax=Quercus suber TaxID=58331 RepID=A0AAW0LDY4_QUESU